ncbi:MAG TPA: MarR family transcriptional regulator [Acidimicrobiales bacterium]|nr:MarR family transcriptional regulator [Acidimicrobiales bacterium]
MASSTPVNAPPDPVGTGLDGTGPGGRAVRGRGPGGGDPGTGAGPDLDDTVRAVEAAITDLFRLASSRRLHQARQDRAGIRLSRTGWEFLRRVDDLGPIRVSRLAGLMDLSLPVTSRALQRLEGDGLVARRADPADGRAACFVATPEGRRTRAGLQAAMHDELGAVLSGWPAPDRRVLAEVLPRLVADMRAGSG